MTHIAGHDRSQTLLLPEVVDDYVGPENPVRFIDAFVNGLDLAEAGFGGMAAKRPDILDRRRETVEHPFGTIKQWMNQGAFLMRGLEKVRAEFSLTALAYNLRRVLNIVGFADLMAAVAA